MKVAVYKVKCITNLHIGGTGNTYGIIDNEVEKDVVLGTPILPSSGIKGALREFWQMTNGDNENERFIFGGRPTDDSVTGRYKFLNGQLLLRPMRVSQGDCSYCMVTTPELLRTFTELLLELKVDSFLGIDLNGSSLGDDLKKIVKCLNVVEDFEGGLVLLPQEKNFRLEVEGYALKGLQMDDQNNLIYKILTKIVSDIPIVLMKTEFFNTVDLPIIARNRLENGISRNLWYEEIVPHQSIFYFGIVYEGGESVFESFNSLITGEPISFGGNSSVGYGYCKLEQAFVSEGKANVK